MKNIELSYGCDICCGRYIFDNINWITSSFGVCDNCYNKLNKKDKERLAILYE